MTDRLIIDLAEDGHASVSTMLDGELFTQGAPAELSWPVNDGALKDLRWYLEDYLIAPFAVYEDAGARIDAALRGWGESVFSSVFGSGKAREAYVKARTRGDVELVFRSSSPSLLGLPWELIADPDRSVPLALDTAGVSRSLPVGDAAETVPVPGGRLRVLLVISRPSGSGDVGYRMIARPLLERLEAVRGQVDLVVLRPPALDALRTELSRAAADGAPYQIVHFDGHGVLDSPRPAGSGAPLSYAGHGGEGVLVFEKPGGGADHVRASRVAQVLKDARVPVVILNACQSGAVGKKLEAAVATRLLHDGIASVVAMAYSVYAVAAAEFMAAFYERLFAGGTVSAAVTAGRQQMFRRPGRPSPKGDLPLADWLVPVHYFRREVRFPQAVMLRGTESPSLAEALESLLASPPESGRDVLDARDGVFIGRDALLYELEVAGRLQKVVVLVGPGGTGKTELAKAFGRWWRDTGGVDQPKWVFWHSFEPGVASFGLEGVITEIGKVLYGTEFALKEREQQRAVVEQALVKRRMLLIWDNFESVHSMPDPGRATPTLNEHDRGELREFLVKLAAGGKSSVLITSRTSEDWLGDIRRIEVGCLARHEAVEYAGILLAPYPSAHKHRQTRAFSELMEWLSGHPLSMRLVLPRLDSTAPGMLVAELQGTVPVAGFNDEHAGRTQSLAACITYSYAHLAESTRRLLPLVSLCHTVANAAALSMLSAVPAVPERFAGATADDWVAALDDAARVGLLTGIEHGLYRIHPALSGYLAAVWRNEEPKNHEAARDAATKALVVAYSALGQLVSQQIMTGDAELAYEIIALEHRTSGQLLSYALDQGLWDYAALIVQPLDEYWAARGLDAEADAWADRARLVTEAADGTPPRLDTPAGVLWACFTMSQANRELSRHHFADAESTCLQFITALESTDASPQRQRRLGVAYELLGIVMEGRGWSGEAEEWYRKFLAVVEEFGDRRNVASAWNHLGSVAQLGGRHGEAEDRYRSSLAIRQKIGDRPAIATTYHQLGILAHDQRRLGEAKEWSRKALAIQEELGDQPGIANTCHALANTAFLGGRLGEAEEWSLKSLVIAEELGRRPGMASSYHQLGMIAAERRRLDEAEEWCRKALAMEEELGDRLPMASIYHKLGDIASLAGRLGDAEGWYRKALAIREELGDRPGIAWACQRLGNIAMDQGRLDEAEEWSRMALPILEELGDRTGIAVCYSQLGMVAEERGRLSEAEGWYRQSLAFLEELEDRRGVAVTYGQIGWLAEAQGRMAEALAWIVKSVTIFSDFAPPATGPGPEHLARLTSQLGMPALERSWREVAGEELPGVVRDYVQARIREEAEGQ